MPAGRSPAAEAAKVAVRAAHPVVRWVRRHGWRVPVHLVLAVFAFANLYPFMWMLGTSAKSVSEAAVERHDPVPRTKYYLAPGGTDVVPAGILEPQLRTLADLTAAGAGRGSVTIDPIEYTVAHRVDVDTARRHLEGLRDRGLMSRDDGNDASTSRYRPTERGLGGFADGLGARQLHMLVSLRNDDIRRARSMAGHAASSMYVEEYAANYRIERDAAQREIDTLRERGLVTAGRLQLENFGIVWNQMHFYLFFLTSLIVTVIVVALTVILTSMLGYALARLKFPGKMWILALLIIGAVAPREAVIIPIFRMLKAAGALQGIWGMTLWMTGAGIGNTFLMAGYFLTIPKEMEEAAAIDGAGTFRTFFDIVLPMARPIVMAVGLFAFLGAWNNFLIPLLCTISKPTMQPLAVAVYSFQKGHQGWWNQTNAAAAIMIVPAIAVFVILQKHIVKSIAVGAVKG